MRIIIDPGHSGVWPEGDPGVVSKDGTKIESRYNWIYANTLCKLLHESGYTCVLTRDQDVHKISYSDRTSIATPDDLFISLHFDTYAGGKRLIYYASGRSRYHTNSLKLAKSVDRFFKSNDLRASTSSRFNGLYIDDNDCPAILVEIDRIDRADISTTAQLDFANSILKGVNYYRGEKVEEEDNSGTVEGNTLITTNFNRVFLVDTANENTEIPVERMSVVGDKLYIAPKKEWYEK